MKIYVDLEASPVVTMLKDYVDSSGSDDDESDSSRRDSISISELGWSFSSVDNHLQMQSTNTTPKNATNVSRSSHTSPSSQPIAMFIDSEINMPSSIAPTYADGEYYEDDKADMITQLMANHSGIVTSSLVSVERSNLITRVTCLSWHVPECVLFTVGTYHESETT